MPSVLDTRVHRGGDMDSDHQLVVTSIRLRLTKITRILRRQQFDVELLLQDQRKAEYMETIEKGFTTREGNGSIEERWSEECSTGISTEIPTRQTKEAKPMDVRQDH